MKMTAKNQTPDARKQRERALHVMKALEKRIAAHSWTHIKTLKARAA